MDLYYEITYMLKQLSPLFINSSGDTCQYKLNTNKQHNDHFYISVEYGGDYEIKIFKIDKNTYVNAYQHGANNVEDFFNTFCTINVYTVNNILCNINPLKNIYLNPICPYKFIFKMIFNIKWDEVIRWYIIHKDGNDSMCMVESKDYNYVVKFSTS
jgi:hypothetical protein